MAIAPVINRVNGNTIMKATLVDGATATGNGEWIDARGLKSYNIHTAGITSATVKISGSNDATLPANTEHDIQLGSDITADGMKEFTTPVKWIKARVSTYVSGTITVIIEGQY